MKTICRLVLYFVCIGQASAQNYATLKALQDELQTCQNPAACARVHIRLLKEYEVFNVEKSLFHGQKAWEEAAKDSAKQEMAEAAYRLGAVYQFDDKDKVMATEWYLRALQLSEQTGDSIQLTDCYYNLGLLMSETGNPAKAFQYFNAAIEIANWRKDATMMVMAEVAYGNHLKDPKEQIVHYLKALKASERLENDSASLAQAWSTMGAYYWRTKDYKSASIWYEKVFQFLHGLPLDSKEHYLLELYATACLRTGRYDESIQVAGRIARLNNDPNSSDWYALEGLKLLAEGYYYNNYDSLAFWTIMQYAEKKDTLHEQLNNSRAQRNVQMLETEYESHRQERAMELLQAKNDHERSVAYLLVFGLIICGFLLAYLFRKTQIEHNQNKQLARLNQTKDKILSIISHDVRSPIQALQNIIALFEQGIATKEDVHTVTKQVSASVQSMAQGLDNLFYWAQSQQQELKSFPESFNLTELVITIVDLFSERLLKKEITVEHNLREPIFIYADILHTRLIVSNVLVNAIKFSPAKAIIKIHFSFDHAGNGILSVADSGKGIPEEDIVKIFDPAIRYTRPGTAGEPGSGLGLSLTRDLLHLDNNEITIISSPKKGTIINILFTRKNPLRDSSFNLPDS